MNHTNSDPDENERLKEAGFQTVSVADFRNLSPEEDALLEMRLALSRALRMRREGANLTQVARASRVGSSQSRIAKAERGHTWVSRDLMVRALLATGATQRDVAQALTPR